MYSFIYIYVRYDNRDNKSLEQTNKNNFIQSFFKAVMKDISMRNVIVHLLLDVILVIVNVDMIIVFLYDTK